MLMKFNIPAHFLWENKEGDVNCWEGFHEEQVEEMLSLHNLKKQNTEGSYFRF